MTKAGTAVAVICKAPEPGRVKTRLCPPLEPEEASGLAEASLLDTLDAVAASKARRRVCVLDGAPGPWLPPGFDVLPQVEGGLDARIAAGLEAVGGPVLLVGMDTPQLTASLLDRAIALLDEAPAVLGLAEDGGWWALGLQRPDSRVVEGVPMSTRLTGRVQLERLEALGLRVAALPRLRDFDVAADLRPVAAEAPHTTFAARVAALDGRVP